MHYTYYYISTVSKEWILLTKIFLQAEEIAALNLAKYRQVQTNLAGAVERADVSEQALAKSRARSRASSLAPVSWESFQISTEN